MKLQPQVRLLCALVALWVHPENATKLVRLIREFGFEMPKLSEEVFLQKGRIIRMGVEPVRIELLTQISGCEFPDCYSRRVEATLDGTAVIIGLQNLV